MITNHPKKTFFRRHTLLGGVLCCLLALWLNLPAEDTPTTEPQLKAGAYVQDVTPPFESLLINGGFLERRLGKMNPGDLKARCFVLQRGEVNIAIAVVDSCMIPRDVCDQAKALAFKATGIPPERILITATHTHSAPSTMDYCLGTMADPAYTKFLPSKIAAGIAKAHEKLEPAQIGWEQIKAPGYTNCRRWITRPDELLTDPFGEKSVRAMMHPGYQNPKYIGPSGPVDDELSLLSIQALDGSPLAVLANFSMHYHGGGGPADYFGLFADRLAQRLTVDGESPICAMTQGTSGDLYRVDYSNERKADHISHYTDGLVKIAGQALKDTQYHQAPPLEMDQQVLTLQRRLPDEKRLAWADTHLTSMKGRRPKSRPEVYAEQARFIHQNPTEKVVLQTMRIGDLAITATPNEVYSITGLKLKARSPFSSTFNIELANGAAGYIPPPEQHALGGYTTWPARTAGLEVEAEPKIVEAVLASLEKLSGNPRKPMVVHTGTYPETILADNPLAYWQCEEFDGGGLTDVSGNDRNGRIEGMVAYHLPGPANESFSGKAVNSSLQLVGGSVSASVPGARSISFWFWNGMSGSVRDNTGDLVQNGESLRLRIGGKADTGSAGTLIIQSGNDIFKGSTKLTLRTWHHVMVSSDGRTINLYLDGNPQAEVVAPFSEKRSNEWTFGGTLPFEGRIDEASWFSKTLTGEDAKRHYTASGMIPPPRPVPPRPKFKRGTMSHYQKAIIASKPAAYWPLQESAKDQGSRQHHGSLEKGVVPATEMPQGNTFNGGRMRADVAEIGDTYSVGFWVRNTLPAHSRPVTAYLYSRGIDGQQEAEGDHLGIGGTHAAAGRLIIYSGNRSETLLKGKTKMEPESWHHVVMIREGGRVRVHLNGNHTPEIDDKFPRAYPDQHRQFFFGGRCENFANLQGRLDHIALFDRVLTPKEITSLYQTVKLTPDEKKQTKVERGPLSPIAAIKTIHVPEGYQIQLVAAEPLVQDPVAIDWAPDGKLWVAEMADYPSGIDGKPGGRVRFLEDLDGDGVYDKSTLFLEGVNFPAGIMSWRKGVLVAAAPDIIYAEDTDGDGRADVREVLFTGFKQGNQQLRVNGLHWGLDNWVHGANGSHHSRYASGIKISSPQSQKTVELGSLDFRIQPDVGLMEPLSGPSQFGRTRDDWGNSFGVQNSFPLWHYVLEHRYLSRNPNFAAPDPRRQLRPQNPRVFQATSPQKRFHSFNNSGRFTSACSPMIYRDDFLFDDDRIHAFTCEPFHNLVQHMILTRDGCSFTAKRAEEEKALDFFTSEDRWSRPVMARTGPDGALWVVDMYRYMIEHPDWLPAAGKTEMKPHERKGSGQGRIYRIFPKTRAARPIPRLDTENSEQLVRQLAAPNGIIRDLAHRLLVERKAVFPTDSLSEMAQDHDSAKARLHALCVLDGIDRLSPKLIESALRDSHPQVRRHALRLAESRWKNEPSLLSKAIALARDQDAAVRLQAACSLGTSESPQAGLALAQLAVENHNDLFFQAAVFSSAHLHFNHLAKAALEKGVLIKELIKLGGKQSSLDALVSRLATPDNGQFTSTQLRGLAYWLDHKPTASTELGEVIQRARKIIADDNAPIALRTTAAGLLGRQSKHLVTDRTLLARFLSPQSPSQLKLAAIAALAREKSDKLPSILLLGWSGYLPKERTRILDTLLQRPVWTKACLEALAKGEIALRDLDASRRQLLLTHSDPEIRKTADLILRTGVSPERLEQIKPFRAALKLKGNKEKGEQIFEKLCAVCHLPAKGISINGPDLRSITDRTQEGLFSSILIPNQSVDPSYTSYTVTLGNDTSLFGRVLSENANHLTLRLLDGTDRQLSRKSIKTLVSTGRSLMPDGLETAMTPQNLADLIRFLQGFGQAN